MAYHQVSISPSITISCGDTLSLRTYLISCHSFAHCIQHSSVMSIFNSYCVFEDFVCIMLSSSTDWYSTVRKSCLFPSFIYAIIHLYHGCLVPWFTILLLTRVTFFKAFPIWPSEALSWRLSP